MLYNYKSTFSVKTDSTEKQSLHLDLANGHDDDVVPKALRPCTVRILDTTTNQELSLPGRIHSWTTVFDLKQKIMKEKQDYSIEFQRLFLHNQLLDDKL